MRYQRGLSLVGSEEILHCVQNDNTNNVILSETKDLKVYTIVHRHGDLEILHCVQNDKV